LSDWHEFESKSIPSFESKLRITSTLSPLPVDSSSYCPAGNIVLPATKLKGTWTFRWMVCALAAALINRARPIVRTVSFLFTLLSSWACCRAESLTNLLLKWKAVIKRSPRHLYNKKVFDPEHNSQLSSSWQLGLSL